AAMLRTAAATVRDLLYPPRCVHCGTFGRTFLCEPCAAVLEPASGPGRCANCCAPWDGEQYCPDCHHWRNLERGVAAFTFGGPARAAVHALKYQRTRAIVPRIAGLMAGTVDVSGVDAFFAVPLHRSRQRVRGFNQAEL